VRRRRPATGDQKSRQASNHSSASAAGAPRRVRDRARSS
jgi:hypothetical protein